MLCLIMTSCISLEAGKEMKGSAAVVDELILLFLPGFCMVQEQLRFEDFRLIGCESAVTIPHSFFPFPSFSFGCGSSTIFLSYSLSVAGFHT